MIEIKEEQHLEELQSSKSFGFDNRPLLPVNFQKNSTYNADGLLILPPKVATKSVDLITLFLKCIINHPDDLIGDEYIFDYPDALTTDWSIIKEYLIQKNQPATISEASKALYPIWCERAHESYLFFLVWQGNDKNKWPEFVLLWEKLIQKALKEFKSIAKNKLSAAPQNELASPKRLRKGPAKREFENFVADPTVKFIKQHDTSKPDCILGGLGANFNMNESAKPINENVYDQNGILLLEPEFLSDSASFLEIQIIISKLFDFKYNIIGHVFVKGYPNIGNVVKLFMEFCNYKSNEANMSQKFQQMHQLYLYYQQNMIKGKRPKCVNLWKDLLAMSISQLSLYKALIEPVNVVGCFSFNSDGVLVVPPKYLSFDMISSSEKFVEILIDFGCFNFIKEKLVYKNNIGSQHKENLKELKEFRQKLSKCVEFGAAVKETAVVNNIIFRIHAEYLCFKFTVSKSDKLWPKYLLHWDAIIFSKENVLNNDTEINKNKKMMYTSASPEKSNLHYTNGIVANDFITHNNDEEIEEMVDSSVFFSHFKQNKELGKTYIKRNNEYDANGLLILKPHLKRIPVHIASKTNFCLSLKEYPVNLMGFKFVLDYPDIGIKTVGDLARHTNKINSEANTLHSISIVKLKELTETIHQLFLYYLYNFSDKIEQWPLVSVIWGEIIQRSFIEKNLLAKFLELNTEVHGEKYNKDNYLILEPEIMDSTYGRDTCLLLLKSLSQYPTNIPRIKYTLCEEKIDNNDWLNFQKFCRIQSQTNLFFRQFSSKESKDLCERIHKEYLYFKAVHNTNRKNIWPQYLVIWDYLLSDNDKLGTPAKNVGNSFTVQTNNHGNINESTSYEHIATGGSSSIIQVKKQKYLKLLKMKSKYQKKKKKLNKKVKGLKHNITKMEKTHTLDILKIEKSIDANNLLFRSKIQAARKRNQELDEASLLMPLPQDK